MKDVKDDNIITHFEDAYSFSIVHVDDNNIEQTQKIGRQI